MQTKINSYAQAHSNQQYKGFIEAALKTFSPTQPVNENIAPALPKGWYGKKSDRASGQYFTVFIRVKAGNTS